GAAAEGLDDLDPLLGADGEVLDQRVGVQVEAEAGGDLPHQRPGRREVEQAAPGRLVPEHHVLRDGEDGHQHEVLVDHTDAGVHRIAGIREGDRPAVDDDLTAVGPVQPVQDVHQGGFAG